MDKVYIIIVNYKSDDFITNAIKSINESTIDTYILIVDNECSNQSIKVLNKLTSKNLEVIRTDENIGFAGGVNFGFEYLESKVDDLNYLFLLNPDAIATDNIIGNLLKVLKSSSSYVAISPHIFDNQTKKDWFSGTMIDFKNCKISNNPILSKNNNSIIDVFNGCAVIMDAKKFKKAGKFDEDTFLYYDEANLSMNFSSLNYKSVYVPTLEVYHDVSSSTGKHSYLKSYYMTRNHIYFFRKFSKSNILTLYKTPLKNLLSHIKNLRVEAIRGTIKGIIDQILNKKGKM